MFRDKKPGCATAPPPPLWLPRVLTVSAHGAQGHGPPLQGVRHRCARSRQRPRCQLCVHRQLEPRSLGLPPATRLRRSLTRLTLCAGRHQVKSMGIAGMHANVGHCAIFLAATARVYCRMVQDSCSRANGRSTSPASVPCIHLHRVEAGVVGCSCWLRLIRSWGDSSQLLLPGTHQLQPVALRAPLASVDQHGIVRRRGAALSVHPHHDRVLQPPVPATVAHQLTGYQRRHWRRQRNRRKGRRRLVASIRRVVASSSVPLPPPATSSPAQDRPRVLLFHQLLATTLRHLHVLVVVVGLRHLKVLGVLGRQPRHPLGGRPQWQ